MDLRQFLSVLRARWKFILATLGVGVLLTFGLIVRTTPMYSSTSTLFISTPQTGNSDTYTASLAALQRVNSYSDLALQPEVLQRVIDQLDLNLSTAQLARRIKTSVIESTLLIKIDATADSAGLARQIASAEADEVIQLVKRLETPTNSSLPAPIIARLAGEASLNSTPVSPNVPIDLGTGILLSLLAGIAGALLRDLLDTSVKTVEDVEEITGNALMASLPYDPTVEKQTSGVVEDSGSLGEAFRVLRTNLQFANLDANEQMLVVTSAIPDEGKTFVATNLAISIAKNGRSVLIIDADFRNPSVADVLGLENSVGTISVLLGRATLEQATQEHSSGVSFLGTGPCPPNPSEVLDTQAMREFMTSVRSLYDVVIIDAPPMLPVADAAILLTEVDGALLLVRHGSTNREQLRQAVGRIEAVGGKLFGTILNRVPRKTLDAYGYGYGYDYARASTASTPPAKESLGKLAGRRARR